MQCLAQGLGYSDTECVDSWPDAAHCMVYVRSREKSSGGKTEETW